MNEPLSWAPIGQLIGLEIQPGQVGEAEVFLDVDQRMHNPMGLVHGGVIALLWRMQPWGLPSVARWRINMALWKPRYTIDNRS